MKRFLYFVLLITTIFSFACEHINYQSYILKKDCTGYYFNIQGKDYQICNDSIVSKFKNGVEIEAVVKKIDSCNNFSGIMCGAYHPYEGFIYIEKIK